MTVDNAHCQECGSLLTEDLDGICAGCVWKECLAGEEEAGLIRGFRLGGEIARGGMGIVYRARQMSPDRPVAVKMLRPHLLEQVQMKERFRQEAQAAAALQHPGILPVYQVGEADGVPWFSMMLAEGGTLAARREYYHGQWRGTAQLMAHLAHAVGHAHERGVLHRDLKPGNILFDQDDRAYVCDFGLAKVATAGESTPDWTVSVQLLGTPHYLPPEVAGGTQKQTTTAGDIYALGVILYELLTGRVPFDADNIPALLRLIADGEPARLKPGAVPADLVAITMKCLEKNPALRYPTASVLAADLEAWLAGRTVTARRLSGLQKAGRWVRRNPLVSGLAAALCVAIVTGVGYGWQRQQALRGALAGSRLNEADALSSGHRAGRRLEALRILSESVGISPAVAVRTSAAAALAVTDLTVEQTWEIHPVQHETRFDFTPDLRCYAVTVTEGGVGVFETRTHRRLAHFPLLAPNGKPGVPMLLQFSPDGKWLGACLAGGRVELYEWALSGKPPLVAQRTAPAAVRLAFSPDTRSCLILTDNHSGTLLTLPDGVVRKLAWPGTADVSNAAFSPDGTRIALAAENAITVVQAADAAVVLSVIRPIMGSALAWDPDSRMVAFAELKGHWPEILDTKTGLVRPLPTLHTGRVSAMTWHPDGKFMATAGEDGRVVLTDTTTNTTRPLQMPGLISALRFSQDGQRLGYAAGRTALGVAVLQASPVYHLWPDVKVPGVQAFSLAVSPDGEWIATAGDEKMHLYSTRLRRDIDWIALPYAAWYRTVHFGADPQTVFISSATAGIESIPLEPKTLTPEGPDGPLVGFGKRKLIAPQAKALIQGFADDGTTLVVCGFADDTAMGTRLVTISLWPEADPARAQQVLDPGVPVVGLRLVPHTAWAVSRDLVQPDVRIWDMEGRKLLRRLGLPGKASCDISADGRYLVTVSGSEYRIYRTGTWEVLSQWSVPVPAMASQPWISPDGTRVVTTSGSEGQCEWRTVPEGRLIATLLPPGPLKVNGAAYSPDGNRLYFLTDTRQIVEWDLGQLREAWARLGVPDDLR